jgi:hypothetical protein
LSLRKKIEQDPTAANSVLASGGAIVRH